MLVSHPPDFSREAPFSSIFPAMLSTDLSIFHPTIHLSRMGRSLHRWMDASWIPSVIHISMIIDTELCARQWQMRVFANESHIFRAVCIMSDLSSMFSRGDASGWLATCRSVSELEVNYPNMLVFDKSKCLIYCFISQMNLEKSPQKTFVIFKSGHSGGDFFITTVASCLEDEASEHSH